MRYRILLALWVITDLLLFVASYAIAYFLRVGFILSTDFPFNHYIISVCIAAPLWLLVLATTRTFFLTHRQTTLRNGAYMFYAAVVGVAFFTLIYYFEYTQFFSRALLIVALVLQAGILWLWHIMFDAFRRSMLRKNPPTFPVLDSSHAMRVPVAILENKGIKDKDIEGVPVLGKLNKLEDVLATKHITHLIQCSDLEQSINLLSACRARGITYMLLPSVLGMVERDEQIESLEGWPVTVVHPKMTMMQRFFA